MAKKKTKPTASDVVAYLEKHGPQEDWRAVPGMNFNSVRQELFDSGKAELTKDGGLRLKKKTSKETE